mmetsp:Transcript_4473/g.7966  ORF Transcript_4473/g.7966 Transcript_4473/m.7966 type:complete len:535 (-) Transcript_4473:134-1738(-)
MNRNQAAVSHLCYMDYGWAYYIYSVYTGGLPLHYYLARTANVDLDTVKLLVMAHPEALVTTDIETKCTPIHAILLNSNIGTMFDVVKFLVEKNYSPLTAIDCHDQTPLHIACCNSNITTVIVQLLLKVWPEATHLRDNCQSLPLHSLCCESKELDDTVAVEVLSLLLEAHPDSVTQTDDDVNLPIHSAAMYNKSPGFCKILVNAYPESVRWADDGHLPFHKACKNGRPDTVKYLFELYPESIGMRTDEGFLPIHEAASCPGINTAAIIGFLLTHDPDSTSKAVLTRGADSRSEGSLPLHLACAKYDHSGVAELLFDLHPEAILTQNLAEKLPIDELREKDAELPVDSDGTPYNAKLRESNTSLIAFLQTQLNYARQAKDDHAMTTPDCNGWLPLHHALHNNAPLGTIYLLLKGNPDAFGMPDKEGVLPLNIACQFAIVDVVKVLVDLHDGCLKICDVNNDFPLHYACRGGNCDVVKYLLKEPMASISEKNTDGFLPIHLFCDFVKERWCDGKSTQYLETMWRLLMAYPETVLNW